MELGHLDKHAPATQKENSRREKITSFFAWKLSSYVPENIPFSITSTCLISTPFKKIKRDAS